MFLFSCPLSKPNCNEATYEYIFHMNKYNCSSLPEVGTLSVRTITLRYHFALLPNAFTLFRTVTAVSIYSLLLIIIFVLTLWTSVTAPIRYCFWGKELVKVIQF
jgi:hypothetical protein